MHLAAYHGHQLILRFLLDARADPQNGKHGCKTPLHLSALTLGVTRLHAGIPKYGKSELCGRAAPSDDFCTVAQMISNPSHICMLGTLYWTGHLSRASIRASRFEGSFRKTSRKTHDLRGPNKRRAHFNSWCHRTGRGSVKGNHSGVNSFSKNS